jgi:hypothetical protein
MLLLLAACGSGEQKPAESEPVGPGDCTTRREECVGGRDDACIDAINDMYADALDTCEAKHGLLGELVDLGESGAQSVCVLPCELSHDCDDGARCVEGNASVPRWCSNLIYLPDCML